MLTSAKTPSPVGSVRGAHLPGQGALLGAAADPERVREGDPARHRPHLPRARLLQEEGRRGPGVAVQRDEGLQHPRQGGGLLPGQRLHRGAPLDGGEWSDLRARNIL